MISFKWAVKVNPNESFKVTVDDDKFLHVTQHDVALGEVKKGEEVEDVHVYLKIINFGEKVVMATLSSEGAPQADTNVVLHPNTIIELSHDRKDGSVHISGKKIKVFGLKDYDTVFGATTKGKTPTTAECMKIVQSFPGYEDDTPGYYQALCVFTNKSARENFMFPKTDASRMEFLKVLIAGR